jgi:hypothetical protein
MVVSLSLCYSQIDRWVVLVSGAHPVEELRRAPDDVLSFLEAIREVKRFLNLRLDDSHCISFIGSANRLDAWC